MKRHNHLLDKICDLENLYTAYYKARRGKEAKQEVVAYTRRLDRNIAELQRQIRSGNADVGNYRQFVIHDPKERVICAAPFSQRVLHHALMNVCGELMDRRQIYDSYACRVGKGSYAALERAGNFHRKYAWCVKMDVRKYFDSIDHVVLKKQLYRLFKEPALLNCFYAIIDSYEVMPGRGLPIGNLTSQFCANHYLCGLDHYVLEGLSPGAYVRYMDDMMMYGNDRALLSRQAQAVERYLREELHLELKVLDIRPTRLNTQFLGYRLSKGPMLLSRRSMKRYKSKLRLYHTFYNEGVWDESALQQHLMPLVSFVVRAECRRFCIHSLERSVG